MPRGKIKSRNEILRTPFITKTEIKRLMGVGWDEASQAFEMARQRETEELGHEPLCKTKAKTKMVLSVFGLTYEDMTGGVANV